MAGITSFAMVQTSRTLYVRSSLRSRVFLPAAFKPTQARCLASAGSQPPSDAVRRGVEEVKKAGDQMKDQVVSHAKNMANQSKDAAGAAENIAEKAKKTAQDAWNIAKEKAQKIKDDVSEKAEEAADAVKDNIDAAKRKMD